MSYSFQLPEQDLNCECKYDAVRDRMDREDCPCHCDIVDDPVDEVRAETPGARPPTFPICKNQAAFRASTCSRFPRAVKADSSWPSRE
jgi:hypothetical protein